MISRGLRENSRGYEYEYIHTVQYVGESYHEHVGMLYHQNLYVKQSIGAHSRVATNTAPSAVT